MCICGFPLKAPKIAVSVPRVVVYQVPMLDSFCYLRSLIFGAIKLECPKMLWMPESLSGSMVWWWNYMHTLMYMLVVVHYL